MNSSDKCWLVKSGSHVLGPFSKDSIEEQLNEKAISVRDEVISHMKNWIEISDEPNFASIVEKLRVKTLSEEFDDITNTKTVAGYQLENYAEEELPTEELEQDKELQVTTPLVSPAHVPAQQIKSFKTKRENHSFNVFLSAVALLVLLTAGYLSYQKNKSKSFDRLEISLIYKQSLLDFKAENYKSAIWSLQRLTPEQLGSKGVILLAKNYIQNKEYSKARNLLNTEKGIALNKSVRFNLVGLSYLNEKELIISEEYFNKAVARDSKYIPAVLNLAMILVNNNKADIAFQKLKNITIAVEKIPEYHWMYGIISLKAYFKNKDKDILQDLQNSLKNKSMKDSLLFQETSFLTMYVDILLNKKINDIEFRIIKILDNDPMELGLSSFTKDVNQEMFSWGQIIDFCDDLTRDLNARDSKLLLSFCRYKEGDMSLAKSLISEVLRDRPDHPLYLALAALYEYKNNEVNFTENLKLSLETNEQLSVPYTLPFMLKITDCMESKNSSCISKYAGKILKYRPRSIMSQAAQAKVLFINKEYKQSLVKATQLQIQNPGYKPMIDIINDSREYVQ